MKLIEEVYKGKNNYAFFFIVIGKKFQRVFQKTTLPFYKRYCKKYGIGILTINNYIDQNYHKNSVYNRDPGYQRLLAPELIKKKFPRYKFLCDIDVDCIPGFYSRNIFNFKKKIKHDEIYLINPSPDDSNKVSLGKRMSLLRKLFIDKKYPLDSIITATDNQESKLLGYSYRGPLATIGTCIGTTETLATTGNQFYKEIGQKKNFEYLQVHRINHYSKNFKIIWMPYQFQAIWTHQISLYYPFLFKKELRNLFYECLMATLHRVDFLHFAGSWPENLIFFEVGYNKKGQLKNYYEKLNLFLNTKTEPKSYGRIKYKKKFII